VPAGTSDPGIFLRRLAGAAGQIILTALIIAVGIFPSPVISKLLPVQTLSIGDGLPQSQVTALVQDTQGYLWVGTLGGLSRYDGDRFATFTVRDGLPSNRIRVLMVDTQGRIWVGTGAGLALVEKHTLRTLEIPGLEDEWCGALLEGRDGQILVGTEDGLRIISRGKDVPGPADLPRSMVTALAQSEEGILIAFKDGIFLLEHSGKIRKLPPPDRDWSGLTAMAIWRDELWAGGGGDGLWTYTGGSWREILFGGNRIGDVWRMEVDHRGLLAVASNGSGLYLFNKDSEPPLHLDRSDGLPSDVVNCYLRDREDNLWVGTDIGGLSRLGGAAFVTMNQSKGLPDSCVFGLRKTPDGLWACTLAGAALLRPGPDPEVLRIIDQTRGLSHPVVWTAAALPDGNVFFLTNMGVDVLPAGAVRAAPVRNPAIPENPFDLLDTPDGRLWAAGRSTGAGLAVREPDGTWRAISTLEDGEEIHFVRCLAPRRAGGVWAGLGRRIAYSEGDQFHLLGEMPSLPGRSWITVILEDHSGRLWAGNDTGLSVRPPGGSFSPVESPLLSMSPHVFALAEDSRGEMWIGTSQGVLRLAPDGSSRLLTPEDGLAAFETNEHGLMADGNGVVWIGTIGGLSRYDPSQDHPLTQAPPLIIEKAVLPDRSIDFPEKLKLQWNERHVSFQIGILAFRDHSRCFFRARLEGVDEQWLPLRSGRRELRYTNLPAGHTRLILQPISATGLPGKQVILPIEVQAPLWRRPWFQGLCLAMLLLLALAGHRWRLGYHRRRALELEAEVAARTEELKNLAGQLEHLAHHDALTGLPNRRLIWNTLNETLRSPGGKRRRCGVLLLDLDHFKEVNDSFGHLEGDRILREVAHRLLETIRPGDIAGRFGGDEFLIVLPGADRDAVEAVAKRIGAISIEARSEKGTIRVTLSVGAVPVPSGSGEISPEQVLLRADELAYRVKKRGRAGWEIDELDGRKPKN